MGICMKPQLFLISNLLFSKQILSHILSHKENSVVEHGHGNKLPWVCQTKFCIFVLYGFHIIKIILVQELSFPTGSVDKFEPKSTDM